MSTRQAVTGVVIALLATGLAAQEGRSTATSPVTTVTDIDGNVYGTVTIGDQVWMAQDLRTTRYRNGDPIGTTTPARLDISGENAPKHQWAYAGDEGNVSTYGRLYTWYAATDSRAIAPAGWHVPTDAEWTALSDFLGGNSAAQGKLKEAGTTHWNGPNADAGNESGFGALPGGNRWPDGRFLGIGDFSHWWTATEHDDKYAWRRILVKDAPAENFRGSADKKIGWLVRCVRDAPVSPAARPHAQENGQSTPADNAPTVTYVANEGFLLEQGGRKVLVDALFDGADDNLAPSPELLEQMTAGRAPFAGVDLLLVTHPHGDHFNPRLVAAHLRASPRTRLIAHTQTVDQLRKEPAFEQIAAQIHEARLDPGGRERVTVNGIPVDVLCLPHGPYYRDGRNVHEQVRNLAFFVDLGGTRFLHMGDAVIDDSSPQLSAYPFREAPVDVLFAQLGLTDAAQRLIAEKIKPSQIVAMHVAPEQVWEEAKKIRTVFPHAIVFKQSMERRSLPIEVDFHNLSGEYFGQTPPGATPEVFARGIVSTDANEHSVPSFSPDGNEVFWWANRWPGPDNKEWEFMSMTMRRENGRWSAPHVTPFGQMVAFAPDGRRAYFGSEKDIWVAEKRGDDWSKPKCLGLVTRYPELREVFSPTIARNGALYFMGYAPGPRNDFGVYRAELVNGDYAKPALLPRSINAPVFLNWAPFIAPDESYLLFSSNRRDPDRDDGDLYISRRLASGDWTDPVSLGETVNTPQQEVFPGLSPDGKYLFFCRTTPGRQNEVYWVSAASIPALRR